jgi:hypothetical protein
MVFDEDSFPFAASPNLTDLDFLCESGSLIFTIGTPVSLAGSSIALACQPAPIVPSGFEPQVAPMPVPVPVPRVPTGFPPRAVLYAPDHRSWWSNRLPGQSDRPLYRRWRSDRPLWKSDHLGALRRACCFARRGSNIADRLHPSSTTICDTVARDSTSPPDHGRTRDTAGELSPDGYTGQRRFLATS